MMYQDMTERLKRLAEPEFASYQKKIVSDTRYPMLYIRMPKLRQLAAEIAKEGWRTLAEEAKFETYEETLTVGLAIACAKVPFVQKWEYLRSLLPRLDSWAMTDTIAPTLKPKQEELPLVWDFAMECLDAEGQYVRRFGLILMLDYFLTPDKIQTVEKAVSELQDGRYYVRMAQAWLLAEMAVHDFDRVENLLRSDGLETFIHNMTIRKMRESYRITPEQKAAVCNLKRKTNY